MSAEGLPRLQGECIAVPLLAPHLWRQPQLAAMLEMPLVANPLRLRRLRIAAWAGWGLKLSGRLAARQAARSRLPLLRLEDGFLRSVNPGATDAPLSVVVDDLGIYYDAARPSRLEALVGEPLSAGQTARARALAAAWRAARVSKYNHLRDYGGALPERYVLVADQTFGDAAIRFGDAGPGSFERMLRAALEENPEAAVLVKVHPEVLSGRKRGHFDPAILSSMPRVQMLGEDAHPVSLIENAAAVYVVTSQIGFEGLLWGKRVRTFGMPFYAGWGLTEDTLPAPGRRSPVALENLVHAALAAYPRYLDPETGRRCEAERLIEWMGLQRRLRARFPAEIYAYGFSNWKRPILRDFLPASNVRIVQEAATVSGGASLALWGNGPAPAGLAEGVSLIRVEDGFLRSVGLGADLVRPLSWVMDRSGIHYDPSRPSDLETLLQSGPVDPPLLARARALRERLVAGGLTKYNLAGSEWRRPGGARRVILVPGQVESDEALAYGAPGIRRNLELLRAVREANPDAYVVYKPHPEVVAGSRAADSGRLDATPWCDEQVTDVSMGLLLDLVDEVQVLTSLAGFEALLRGKAVTCYGQPFYAGWGLTRDVVPLLSRTRRLSLDELVAGALLVYPVYLSRISGKPTTVEQALDELLAWRAGATGRTPAWRRFLRAASRLAAGGR